MPGASARRCLRPHDQCSSRARACLRTAAFLTPCAAWPPSLSADRSGAYWFDDEQKQLILSSKAAYEKALGRTITTECAPASDYDQYGGVFYYGEDYHQQYLAKPGARPCERHSCPPDARAPQQLRLPAPRVARACRPCVPSARDAFTRATSPPRAAHACRPRVPPTRVPHSRAPDTRRRSATHRRRLLRAATAGELAALRDVGTEGTGAPQAEVARRVLEIAWPHATLCHPLAQRAHLVALAWLRGVRRGD